MDQDKIQKRQSIKLIVSESIMVIAVIVTVIVLAFLVSGYWINSDFEVERQGMLQVYSTPTGADVDIDGESSWLQRTNTSKILASGEHTVTLTKEGYDSWAKTINISEGLLYKIHYPRLFLKNREREKVYNAANIVIATVSPDRNKMLFFDKNSKCFATNLDEDKIQPKELAIAGLFTDSNDTALLSDNSFAGKIDFIDWSKDNNHTLIHIGGDINNWIIIDVDNVTNSINLTKQFGAIFDTVKILNDSASNLLILQNNNLRKVDVQAKQISAILASNVVSFDYFNDEIAVITKNGTDESYEAKLLKLSSGSITKIDTFEAPTMVVVSKFYDTKYISFLTGQQLKLYTKDDFALVAEFETSFLPSQIKVGHNGEFIIMRSGANIATLDMEALGLREWVLASDKNGWLDDDMIYSVDDGELFVYDFDGLNERKLANGLAPSMPVAITSNKWLYYYSDGYLVREWLIPR